MSEVPSQESVQAAAAAIKEAVAAHGTTHPVVLAKLEHYVTLLRAVGNTAEAEKLEGKASLLRQALVAQGHTLPAAPTQQAAPTPQAAPAQPAVTPQPVEQAPSRPAQPALPPLEDPYQTYAASASSAGSVNPEDGSAIYDLDSDMAEPVVGQSALQQAKATAVSVEAERHLFDSFGEHVATASDGYLYSPEGQYLGRWSDDLGVFLDRKGWYIGQIVNDDRLAYDSNFQFKHINFGDRGNEGDRPGWGRQADVGRTTLPKDFDDVKLNPFEDE